MYPNKMLEHSKFGLGLRSQHLPYIFENKPDVAWFEIISENFMDTEGRAKNNLARLKELYPIAMHGVSLSIGSIDPLRSDYLKKLKQLINWLKPKFISDHLCWTGVAHKTTHDLLPMPYTEEALKHTIHKIQQVQDFLGMQIAFENPSTYLEFKSSDIPEAEFIARMVEQSGCQLLLDVNNVYVNCFNHRLDLQNYVDTLPLAAVSHIHLAGHSHQGTHIIDTHDQAVCQEVWQLYEYIIQKKHQILPTMIEWDDQIPSFETLEQELHKAKYHALQSLDPSKNKINIVNINSYQKNEKEINTNNLDLKKIQSVLQKSIIQKKITENNSQIHLQKYSFAYKKYKRNERKALELIHPKDGFSAQAQLAVYQNAYVARLLEVLEMDYPMLKQYLNQKKADLFEKTIREFIYQIPPKNFNIARFALNLPQFIKNHDEDDVFMYELCDFETSLAQITDLAQNDALSIHDLIHIAEDDFMNVRLQTRSALYLLEYNYPVHKYMNENVDITQKPRKKKTYLIIWVDDDIVWQMTCSADEYLLLKILHQNQSRSPTQTPIQTQTLAKALEIYEKNQGKPIKAHEIFNYFSRWMEHKILAKI